MGFLSVLSALRQRLEVTRYSDYTIAEYFRRQGATIGDDCQIMVRKLSSEPFLIQIGNHCTISPEVLFITQDGGTWMFAKEVPDLQNFGRIDILDNCFIGQRAILMPGVRIGPNAVVGAGAIVTKDVPPDTVVAGSPARVIGSVAEYRMKAMRIWERQRPPGHRENATVDGNQSLVDIQQHRARSWPRLRTHLQRLFA